MGNDVKKANKQSVEQTQLPTGSGSNGTQKCALGFNDSKTDAIFPHDPILNVLARESISKNVPGEKAMNVKDVKSDYDEIKKHILDERKKTGESCLYHDKDFPDDTGSLCYPIPFNIFPPWEDIKWKRPGEMSKDPKLITEICSDDVIQGTLGDCWFISSCAAIARTPKFIEKIIPSGQDMSGPNYVGMFHFRFWRYGGWVDVIVDDFLPTLEGKPCFASFSHEKPTNEYWLPLLEKAYAKLNKSYLLLNGGYPQDAMEDLTGGIAVCYELGNKAPSDLYRSLYKALRNNSFVTAGIIFAPIDDLKQKTGLISHHAYSVLKAARVSYKGNKVNLLKIRNPWGEEKDEWNKAWSWDSPEWKSLDPATKKRLGPDHKKEGEWWMSYDDFKEYYGQVTICTVGPDFAEDGAPTGDKWLLSTVNHAQWIREVSAGGCRLNISSYATNPQFLLELKEPDVFDSDEEELSNKGMCSIVIGLMQENMFWLFYHFLGLHVYKVDKKPLKKLDSSFFIPSREVASSGNYSNRREVTITAELPPGYYVIVPSTYIIGMEGSFLLRIYTEKKIDLEELQSA